MHPLSLKIRFWLVMVALVAIVYCYPECSLFVAANAFGWFKGCGCCFSCTVFSDDFSTDRTATDYSVRSGSWTVSAGAIATSSSSALIREETATNGSITAAYVSATVSPATNSDAGRVVIGYVDDSNYSFAELQQGATDGTLKIYQRSAGVDTLLNTSTVSGYSSGSKSLCLCYADGYLIAYAGGSKPAYAAASITIASTKAGLGTGSVASSVSFDNFSLKHHKTDNSTCGTCCGGGGGGSGTPSGDLPSCANCTAPYPEFLAVTVTGLANNGCTHCTDWNQTYILPYNGNGTLCQYYAAPGPQVCNQRGVGGTAYHVWVDYTQSGGLPLYGFNLTEEGVLPTSTVISTGGGGSGSWACDSPPVSDSASNFCGGSTFTCNCSGLSVSIVGF